MRRLVSSFILSLVCGVAPVVGGEPERAATAADATAQRDDLPAAAAVLDQHGAAKVVDWIRERRHGKVTIEVGQQLKAAVGPPNLKLVTAASVLHDLRLAGVTVDELAAELARRGEVSGAPLVIAQKDVGPPKGATTSAHPRAEGAANDDAGDGAGQCASVVPRRAVEIAADRGCSDGVAEAVTVDPSTSAAARPVYTVRGSCYDHQQKRTRRFEAGIKCGTKKLAGQLQVEGSDRPATHATESSSVWFKLVDD